MKKKLTVWESACIITGYGVGGGVLSMPYLAQRNGLPMAFAILAAALLASYVLHLMIADLALKSEGGQIISCLEKFLFRGRLKTLLTVTFFVLMAINLCVNLAAYISGAEEILIELLAIPPLAAKLLFYAAAAVVVLFGLKAVGISETWAVGAIFVLVAVLGAASLGAELRPLPVAAGGFNDALAYFGMAMFAFAAFFSVPQAVEGLEHDAGKIRKAVLLGMLNNFVIIVVICLAAVAASPEVTEVAILGWSAGIGAWAQIVGSVFIVLAMLTTYWSISLALGSIVQEQTNWSARLCWVLATLPSLVLALLNLGGFMEFLRLAGGVIGILVAVMVVPAFRNARREVPGSILTKCGGTLTQVLIIIAYILMGVGSVVPV